jgi:glycosyltransferase involved in cell wall biosynthesis
LKALRILIITHSPLLAELGASQVAMNLGEALKELGHEVIVWSPQPLPPHTKWWQTLRHLRAKVDTFIHSQEAFDLIDSPATLITPQMCQSAVVVARSTQPDILYLVSDFVMPFTWNLRQLIRLIFNDIFILYHMYLVLQGWRRANCILCLGTLEFQWMKKWFPFWSYKILMYFNSLSRADQATLVKVCRQRQPHSIDQRRFLWIGRWASHKGTDVLLAFINKWLKQRPQDIFTIAGCGSNAEKDCPADLLQSGRLKIIPQFERKELYELLANHDIGLFTSKVEGWGLSLNEMLESGMPVFATEAGGTRDLRVFFKVLRPFPPPDGFIIDSKEIQVTIEYVKNFNWTQIAKTYQTTLRQFIQPLSDAGMNSKDLFEQ